MHRFEHQFEVERLNFSWTETTRQVIRDVLETLRQRSQLNFDLSTNALKPEVAQQHIPATTVRGEMQ